MKRFALIAIVASLLFVGQSCTTIDPTEAGFRINNTGDYRGIDTLPLLTGIQWYHPYSTIITIPCTMQHVVWTEDKTEGSEDNQEIKVSLKGGSTFKMDVGINFQVIRDRASNIYLKYKLDDIKAISDTYLRNIVRGTMQDVAGITPVDSLLNNRPAYEHVCDSILVGRFKKIGFDLNNFSIINSPRAADTTMQNAIIAKNAATQNAQRTVIELQSSIAEANKKVSTARGDSAASVIEASGRAEGIKKLQNQLTPEYVEYVKWQNAGSTVPRVPETVLSSSGGYIYQPKK
jgi:regulator of protease activity HflC (stomatin/prohibitin superfamily)